MQSFIRTDLNKAGNTPRIYLIIVMTYTCIAPKLLLNGQQQYNLIWKRTERVTCKCAVAVRLSAANTGHKTVSQTVNSLMGQRRWNWKTSGWSWSKGLAEYHQGWNPASYEVMCVPDFRKSVAARDLHPSIKNYRLFVCPLNFGLLKESLLHWSHDLDVKFKLKLKVCTSMHQIKAESMH